MTMVAEAAMRTQAVQVMTRICRESEASLDYGALFKAIILLSARRR